MATKTRVKFNSDKWADSVRKLLIEEQTRKLIAYAKAEIVKIGNKIITYHSKNHMDRNGHLLNSLCWGVMYNGEVKESGFYREAVDRGMSFLHEFTPESATEVNGRAKAQAFIDQQQGGTGWRIFFAILADYWGYWEGGFRMKSGGGDSGIPRSTRFLKFSVMSQFFDEVRMDLKPTKVSLTVYVPKYSYKSNKYRGKNKRPGIPKLDSRKSYKPKI